MPQIFQISLDLGAKAAGVIHPCPAAPAAVCSCEKQDQNENAARSTDEPLFLEGLGFKNQDILALPVPSFRRDECELTAVKMSFTKTQVFQQVQGSRFTLFVVAWNVFM